MASKDWLRSGLLVLATALCTSASGCFYSNSTVQHVTRGTATSEEVPQGTSGNYDAKVSASADDKLVTVELLAAQCVTRTSTPTTTVDVTRTRMSPVSALAITGVGVAIAGLGLAGYVDAENKPESCPMDDKGCVTQGAARVGGALIGGVGAAFAGYGLYKLFDSGSEKETGRSQGVEKSDSPPRACAADLSGVLTTLRLSDGSTLNATTDGNGRASFQVSSDLLRRVQNNAEVLVGVTVVGGVDLRPLIAALPANPMPTGNGALNTTRYDLIKWRTYAGWSPKMHTAAIQKLFEQLVAKEMPKATVDAPRYEARLGYSTLRYLFSATAATAGKPQLFFVYESEKSVGDAIDSRRQKKLELFQIDRWSGHKFDTLARLPTPDRPGVILSFGLGHWLAVLHDSSDEALAYLKELDVAAFYALLERTYTENGSGVARGPYDYPIYLLEDGTPAPEQPYAAQLAKAAEQAEVAKAAAFAAAAPKIVCDPSGKKYKRMREVKFGKLDAESAIGVGPQSLSTVSYGDLDGDKQDEGFVQYDEFGELGGFHMSWSFVTQLRDGCVAFLQWPEPRTPDSDFSEGGPAKEEFAKGYFVRTFHFSHYPQGWFKSPMQIVKMYFELKDGQLVEDVAKRSSEITKEGRKAR